MKAILNPTSRYPETVEAQLLLAPKLLLIVLPVFPTHSSLLRTNTSADKNA
jgi:hypothetical protein